MPDKAPRNGGWLWRSCVGGGPVSELAGLPLGLRFFKQKIQFARRRVLVQLPYPLLVVTAVDPGHQPVEIIRGQLLNDLFNFFHRTHAGKIPARRCPGNPELNQKTKRVLTGDRVISPSSPPRPPKVVLTIDRHLHQTHLTGFRFISDRVPKLHHGGGIRSRSALVYPHVAGHDE